MKSIDITNHRFGMLTVVSKCLDRSNISSTEHGIKYWNVKCDCGTEKSVRRDHLISGHTKSCGCLHSRLGLDNPNRKGYKDISSTFWRAVRRRMREYKEKKNIESDLTIQEAYDLFLKQNKSCAYTNLPLTIGNSKIPTTASIDRIDSNKGYTVSNIQWVHASVNFIKNDFPEDEFLYFVKLIAQHKGLV